MTKSIEKRNNQNFFLKENQNKEKVFNKRTKYIYKISKQRKKKNNHTF